MTPARPAAPGARAGFRFPPGTGITGAEGDIRTGMSLPNAERHEQDLVGTRTLAEVEQAHRALEAVGAGPTQQTQLSRGALTGYLWALGRGDQAPITGASSEGAPDLSLLTAEADAAVVQLADAAQRTTPRDFTQGVHDALAWICGHSDMRP